MAASNATADMPASLKLLACDAWMRSMHHFLLSGKRGEVQFTYMAKPYGPIIREDKHNAFYEAYTKTIQAGIVPPLTETEVWLGLL